MTSVAVYLSPSTEGHGTHQQLGLPPCPSVLMFDRPCPGCGLTTSWTAFVHGDFVRSFQAHALGPFLYLLFTASAWACLVAALRGQRLVTDSVGFNRALIAVLVVFLGFGGTRMALVDHYAAPAERMYSRAIR